MPIKIILNTIYFCGFFIQHVYYASEIFHELYHKNIPELLITSVKKIVYFLFVQMNSIISNELIERYPLVRERFHNFQMKNHR